MPHLDRPGMIELLERLGAESDATALEAARALHRQVGESGFGWDAVLRTDTAPAFGGGAGDGPLAETPLVDQSPDDDLPAAAPEAPAPDQGEAQRLIDRLLARQTLSGTLREDLVEMKRSMSEGSFDAMDARYVRALAKRLGA
jgi:hypothetical protein